MLARGKPAKHADQFLERAGKLSALVRGIRLADIDPGRKTEAQARAARILADTLASARLSDLAPERIQAALARLRDAGKSHQTLNHYRAALRAFARWAGDKGRLRDDPMRGVKGFNPEEDRRHERRSLTDDKLDRLIQAAERGPIHYGMTGALRGEPLIRFVGDASRRQVDPDGLGGLMVQGKHGLTGRSELRHELGVADGHEERLAGRNV